MKRGMALPSPPPLMTLRVPTPACAPLGGGGLVALAKRVTQICSSWSEDASSSRKWWGQAGRREFPGE